MAEQTPSVAALRIIDQPVMGGQKRLTVRPWSMEQHDEIFPLVADLLETYVAWQDKPETFTLGAVLLRFSAECQRICEATVREELVRQDLKWGDLWGEDLFGLAQAIWNTSIIRPGGGGLLGKGLGILGPMLLPALQKARERSSATSPSSESPLHPSDQPQRPSSSETSSPTGSPSSDGDGGAARSDSAAS